MSMLMRMYYFSVLMLVGMDISIIYFFVTKRIFYHNQCADYHNAEGDIKFYCWSFTQNNKTKSHS